MFSSDTTIGQFISLRRLQYPIALLYNDICLPDQEARHRIKDDAGRDPKDI